MCVLIAMQASDNITRLAVAVLESLEVYRNNNWYWIGAGGLLGFIILFNVLFTLALTYPNRKSCHCFPSFHFDCQD